MMGTSHRLVLTTACCALGFGLVSVAQAEGEPAAAAQAATGPDVVDPQGADGEVADGAEAQGAPAEETDEERFAREAAEFEATLSFQQGEVTIADGLATLSLGQDLRFLDAEGSGRLLQAWGNPPGEPPLGMIFPAGLSPFADEAWGVVVTYEEDGHVDDEDAADIDFDELLEQMQADTEEHNEARAEAGFETVKLVGWAEPPHYDGNTKKLYWAKDLDFGGDAHTLNYSVRVLGRKGVLELNAVANMDQLAMIRGEMTKVMGRVEFAEGNRYADFDPELDEVAAYGIGALIAGKVAAKAGLFKGLIALLLASKKLLVVGGVALLAAVKSLFSRGKDNETA